MSQFVGSPDRERTVEATVDNAVAVHRIAARVGRDRR